MLDIVTLRFIWWVLLGVLLMGFAVTDGFDLGAAILMPLVAKTDLERRMVLKTFSPYWEGNQVWIILGAGAIFAAWPYVYAVAFSGAYFAVLLLLLTMGILRAPSIKYRNKLTNPNWRRFWDSIICISGLFPALILGILVGNVMLGLPFYFDLDLRMHYSGSFLNLFSPFALWCGLVSLAMFVMHGANYIILKTENPLRSRAVYWSKVGASFVILLFAIAGFWVATLLSYKVINVDPAGFSNPLLKHVEPQMGAWLINYQLYPLTTIAPIVGIGAALLSFWTAGGGKGRLAFILSALSIIGLITTVGVSMFPFILPSSVNLNSSLLVWDASSSHLTLLMMFFAVLIFLPIILLYTTWVYRMLRGKVTPKVIEEEEQGVY